MISQEIWTLDMPSDWLIANLGKVIIIFQLLYIQYTAQDIKSMGRVPTLSTTSNPLQPPSPLPMMHLAYTSLQFQE